MRELIAKINEIISKLDGYTVDFQFKYGQIEEDISTISQEIGDSASGSGKAYIAALNSAKNRYRDAIDTLQIAKQRLEEVLMHLA